MKSLFSLALLALSTAAFAHPAGTYMINGDQDALLVIQRVGKCPTVPNALPGTLRSFEFSEKAQTVPYSFETGLYVEIHVGTAEVYVQVDESCVPQNSGNRYEASHESFGAYSLVKIK